MFASSGLRTVGRSLLRTRPSLLSFSLLLAASLAANAQSALTCDATAGVPQNLRQGWSELTSDFVLMCKGGQAGQQQSVTIALSLNTNITSRPIAGGKTEALLIVDEDGSEYPGATPATHQSVRGTGTNTLIWTNVSLISPGPDNPRYLRITNVRANAVAAPLLQFPPPVESFRGIMATVSVLPASALRILDPQQLVAMVQPYAQFTLQTVDCTGTEPLLGAGFSATCGSGQNNSGDRNLLSGNAGDMQFLLRFSEGSSEFFRRQFTEQQLARPGVPNQISESGYFRPTQFPYEVGLASQGTRLYARFINVPPGVRVFVTTRPLSSVSPWSDAALVDKTGTYVSRPLQPQIPDPLVATHTLYCPASQRPGAGAIEIPITSGSGVAVWEVTEAVSGSLTFDFGVALAYSGPAAGAGQIQVRGYLGPTYTNDGATSLDPLPIPRFPVSQDPTVPVFNNLSLSLTPTVLTAGRTTTITIQAPDPSCVAVGAGLTSTATGVTVGPTVQTGTTAWAVPISVAADVPRTQIRGSLLTSLGSLPVTLKVSAPPLTISGRVLRNGIPTSGVPVHMMGFPSGTQLTDASGKWSFTNLQEYESYDVRASLAGHTIFPESARFDQLRADQTVDFIAALWPQTIFGRITKGGTGLAGVTVRFATSGPTGAYGWSTYTDAFGQFYQSGANTGLNTTITPSLASHTFTPAAITISGPLDGHIIDFTAKSAVGLGFHPITPCRVADTRPEQQKTGAFGPPSLTAYAQRDFPIPSSPCQIPVSAQAFSLNLTAIPFGPLDFLSAWPAGEGYPGVSTLNAPGGTVIANAAIVPAGNNGSVTIVAGKPMHLVVDANGYFSPPTSGELLYYPVTPCRVADTRPDQRKPAPFGAPALAPYVSRDIPVRASACNIPQSAQAYALNLTAVPDGPLDFLSVWPAGRSFPGVSTLNSTDGAVIANAAIVPAGTSGAVTIVAGKPAHLIMDISGYFASPGAPGGLRFYPISPCRVLDSRPEQGKPQPFGAPALAPYISRDIALRSSCGIAPDAQAYSLNVTAVPSGPLDFLSIWQAGQPYPTVSTLNAPKGHVIANAAIVPAGTNGDITVVSGKATHLVVDLNGYFAP